MQTLGDFSNTKVLVIGDIMLDRYWWGDVARISPEAPVPVVRLVNKTLAAGGAANVAVNIAGLGAEPILFGIVGNDEEAHMVRDVLKTSRVADDHLVTIESRPTTVKTRVIAHSQQVARIDQETEADLDESSESLLVEKLSALIGTVDSIILSDYAKGLLSDRLIASAIQMAKTAGVMVFVDPKGKKYSKYSGASMITPNRREAAEACNLVETSGSLVEEAGNQLVRDLDIDAVLITHGESGMTLFRGDSEPRHFPASARKVFDVTGAGDTVIATIATAVGAGTGLETAIDLANIAAGLVVEQVGTSSISLQSLKEALVEEN